jgi:hypothetical protein
MTRELITGPNFSGRSAHLMARLHERAPGAAFFVGPYAEAALSGLSSTVADEIAIYARPQAARPAFAPIDFAAYATRKPPTLSGGEQVMLALHCFSRSGYRTVGIDTALEQLDPENRAQALDYLSADAANGFDAMLIDNRIDALDGWQRTALPASSDFACDLAAAIAPLARRAGLSPDGTERRRQDHAVQAARGRAGAFVRHADARWHALRAVAQRQSRVRVRDAEPGPSVVRRDSRRGRNAPPRGACASRHRGARRRGARGSRRAPGRALARRAPL